MNLRKWNSFLYEEVDETPTKKDEYSTPDIVVPSGMGIEEKVLSELSDRFEVKRKLGEGKYGVVYLLESKSSEASPDDKFNAVKIIFGADPGAVAREINNYQFVKDNYQNLGVRRKYFPRVYETKQGTYASAPSEVNPNPPNFEFGYVRMEVLEPIDPRVKTDLLATGGVTLGPDGPYDFKKIDFTERDRRLFSNYETVEKIVKSTLQGSQMLSNLMRNNISDFVDTVAEKASYRFYNKMYGNLPKEYRDAFNVKFEQDPESEETPVIPRDWHKSITGKQGKMLFIMILVEAQKYIFPNGGESVIPYMSPGLLMNVYSQLFEAFKKNYVKPVIPGSFTGRFGREIMKPQPDSALSDFPEAQNIIQFLNDMKQIGFSGFDLHSDNLMVRPRTKDIVVVDLGLFKLEDIEKVEDKGDTIPFFERKK